MQDDRELKRVRRKQSNRESARRSRQKKQAECEDLASKVQLLDQENVSLRQENLQLRAKLEVPPPQLSLDLGPACRSSVAASTIVPRQRPQLPHSNVVSLVPSSSRREIGLSSLSRAINAHLADISFWDMCHGHWQRCEYPLHCPFHAMPVRRVN